MSERDKTTIVFRNGQEYRRLAKVFFGSDGSYYATLPSNRSCRAQIFKITVDYDSGNTIKSLYTDIIESGTLDEQRVKFSHHPDGFAQFSGPGIVSGRNMDGSAKGMAVFTSPLDQIFKGPAFNYAIQNLDSLEYMANPDAGCMVFDLAEYLPIANTQSLTFEAHYFTPFWRRFVRYDKMGRPILNIQHPCGANVELRIFSAGPDCGFPGLIGFELYQMTNNLPTDGYIFGGPTEFVRYNKHGHRVADAIFCSYPPIDSFPTDRILNYPPIRRSSADQ